MDFLAEKGKTYFFLLFRAWNLRGKLWQCGSFFSSSSVTSFDLWNLVNLSQLFCQELPWNSEEKSAINLEKILALQRVKLLSVRKLSLEWWCFLGNLKISSKNPPEIESGEREEEKNWNVLESKNLSAIKFQAYILWLIIFKHLLILLTHMSISAGSTNCPICL